MNWIQGDQIHKYRGSYLWIAIIFPNNEFQVRIDDYLNVNFDTTQIINWGNVPTESVARDMFPELTQLGYAQK